MATKGGTLLTLPGNANTLLRRQLSLPPAFKKAGVITYFANPTKLSAAFWYHPRIRLNYSLNRSRETVYHIISVRKQKLKKHSTCRARISEHLKQLNITSNQRELRSYPRSPKTNQGRSLRPFYIRKNNHTLKWNNDVKLDPSRTGFSSEKRNLTLNICTTSDHNFIVVDDGRCGICRTFVYNFGGS